MKRKILVIILAISVIFNLYIGDKSIKEHRKYSKLAEENFYQNSILLYEVFEELKYDLFSNKDANLNDAKYIKEVLRAKCDKIHAINKNLYNISQVDKKVDKADDINLFLSYEIDDYLWDLSDYVEENGNIPEKEMATLKEIIRRVDLIGMYGETAKNYNTEYDPVPPKTRIYNEFKEIKKLVKEGTSRIRFLK